MPNISAQASISIGVAWPYYPVYGTGRKLIVLCFFHFTGHPVLCYHWSTTYRLVAAIDSPRTVENPHAHHAHLKGCTMP